MTIRMPGLSLALLLLASLCTPSTYAAGGTELKEPLFAEAAAALKSANEAQAAILAPTAYAEAAELYQRAEKTLANEGNLDSIRRDLAKATKLFAKSAKSSAIADVAFGGAIQARADAISAEAEKYAPDAWQDAQVTFAKATSSLERGRKRSAERSASEAVELFRQAELDAIKANYLNETRNLLEQAEENKAKRWAPDSFARASALLAEAETALTENRYDTDRPRSLAQEAKHKANHAIYVSKLADAIDDGDEKLENVLLGWEASIAKLADQVDVPVFFDNGEAIAVASIQSAIVDLQSNLAQQANGINERDEQIKALNSQMQELQKNLGSKSEAAAELNQILAQQERSRMRFAEVEALFNAEEANVLRKGGTVIVRMIGLTFDSGSASLKDAHQALLSSLERAIGVFPLAKVVIEGHTDAFGSDANNLDLSQRRADAVAADLTSRGISPERLTALGYGESQPVANNESADGRRRNRRIDVVIYPPQS